MVLLLPKGMAAHQTIGSCALALVRYCVVMLCWLCMSVQGIREHQELCTA